MRRWVRVAAIALAALLLAWVGFNLVMDPSGAFGDRILGDYGYNMTRFPHMAKMAWLETRPHKYGGFVVGSPAAGLDVGTLAEYTGLDFYDLTFEDGPGSAAAAARYALETHGARHIVLAMGPQGTAYGPRHSALGGGVADYVRCLFMNPLRGVDKLRAQNGYFPARVDAINPETGGYDRRALDAAPVGDLTAYMQANPTFGTVVPQPPDAASWTAAAAEISALCGQYGAELTIVVPPLWGYHGEPSLVDNMPPQATVWDFSGAALRGDWRFFYDAGHARTALGDRMLAQAFGGADDPLLGSGEAALAEEVRVPILLYHHIDAVGNGGAICAESTLRGHMEALVAAGYTAVGFDDLIAFVAAGAELPERPVVITFDDGYASNYEIAYPMLRELGLKGTIFAIGVSVGKDTYKNSGTPIIPHFGLDEMAEMAASGVMAVHSHTFDMHQSEALDVVDYRRGVLPREGEREGDYIAAFRADFLRSKELIEAGTGHVADVFAYPHGQSAPLSEALLREMGVRVSLTIAPHSNVLVRGLPQSLLQLGRYDMTDGVSSERMLDILARDFE